MNNTVKYLLFGGVLLGVILFLTKKKAPAAAKTEEKKPTSSGGGGGGMSGGGGGTPVATPIVNVNQSTTPVPELKKGIPHGGGLSPQTEGANIVSGGSMSGYNPDSISVVKAQPQQVTPSVSPTVVSGGASINPTVVSGGASINPTIVSGGGAGSISGGGTILGVVPSGSATPTGTGAYTIKMSAAGWFTQKNSNEKWKLANATWK